jgi:two-component system NtrC family sensor kinase
MGGEAGMRAAVPSINGDAIAPLRVLLIAAFVVPTILFIAVSILTYREMVEAADSRILQLTEASGEHTAKVFETSKLVLDRIAERVGDMSWDEIGRSSEVHDFLREMKKSLPQANAIGLIDGTGRVVNTDYEFPPAPLFVTRQDYVSATRANDDPDDDIYISEASPGVRTQTPLFAIARHKPHSERIPGRNMINIAVQPAQLSQYYDSIAGDADIYFFLIRSDGAILMKDPRTSAPSNLRTDSAFLRAIRDDPERGSYEFHLQSTGANRIIAYRKIADYPVYIAVAIDRAAIIAAWLRTMGAHLIYGLPVTVALILVTLTAIRRTRHEQVALERAKNEVEKREMVEKQYQQAQKLEAVGQLTGGIAHDFNNLLTVISGNLDLLERHVNSEAGKRMISAMQRAAGRGARLTQSLLAFSRKQPLRPEIVNPNRLINEFGDLLRRAIGDAAEIQFLLSPTLDPCRVDPAQFQSAVLNLVVNARDAIHKPGGKITIQTENVYFDDRRLPPDPEIAAGRYIAVSVIDNGDGMPAEILEHVFEPFFTTKEVGKGSGLGLAQIYGFVKQSGGYVHISSDVQVGTQVSLYLPRSGDRTGTDDIVVSRVAPENRAHAAKILMVEDDAEVRHVVAAELEELGYQVLLAEDGRVALDILERGTDVDLLFSDVVMPNGIRGDELARRARRLRPDLKILLTSGYSAADLEERRSLREFRLLAKPYRAEELARIIEEHLAR